MTRDDEQDPQPPRAEPPPDRGAVLVPCPNGPVLVRGDFDIVTVEGTSVPHRRTVALCQCGASANKPFCDGSHKAIGFRTEPPAPAEPRSPRGAALAQPSPQAGAEAGPHA